MNAITFGNCFGWLHPAEGSTGVLLCNAYGHEALWSHRGMRTLAETLAGSGIPALRFDYEGTGDSIGDEADGDEVARWLISIDAAASYFKKHTGVKQIVLCGLRLGGTLAALAASQLGDIDGLVMMAPIMSGKEYLRELKMIQRRWRNTLGERFPENAKSAGNHVESFGFRLSSLTAKHIAGIALIERFVPGKARVLICDPDSKPSNRLMKLMSTASEHGQPVQRTAFPDYTAIVSESAPQRAVSPTFAAVTQWVREQFPCEASAMVATYQAELRQGMPSATGSRYLYGNGYRETPIVFADGRLFGIYCEPASSNSVVFTSLHAETVPSTKGQCTKRPTFIFSNTASTHRVGDGRMWVLQARLLAQKGVASLRMDVTGLGDSSNCTFVTAEADMHTTAAAMDVSKGVDWLYNKGHREIAAAGVCSGAYLSFNAAHLNPRVTSLVLVNQRIFVWDDKRHAPNGVHVLGTREYMEYLKSARRWKRLLTGRSKLSTIVTVIYRRTTEKLRQRFSMAVGLQDEGGTVRTMLQTLEKRGVKIDVLYGETDQGVEECEIYFGKKLRWLQRCSNVSLRIEPIVDHALFLYPGRELMFDLICKHSQSSAKAPIRSENVSEESAKEGWALTSTTKEMSG